MPLEVWATYSVLDHVRTHAFIADVLLYDRLVIPVPPPDQVEIWEANGWEPTRLDAALEILGTDLARPVTWDEQHRNAFQARVAQDAAARARSRFDVAEWTGNDALEIGKALEDGRAADPWLVTRMMLVDHTNKKEDRAFFDLHPDVYVEAMAAFPSYAAFDEEMPVTPIDDPDEELDEDEALAEVFGWEFFVPEDSTLSDEDLLDDAATLARRPSFRRARTDFHSWRAKVAGHGADASTMRADMERLIGEYQNETARLRRKTAVSRGFIVIGGLTSLAAIAFPPIGIAGGFIALASLAADLMPSGGPSGDTRAAAMFADARRHFGWRDP